MGYAIANDRTAAITSGQARKGTGIKHILTNEVTTKASITKEELLKLQGDSLNKYMKLKEAVTNCDYEVKYEKR